MSISSDRDRPLAETWVRRVGFVEGLSWLLLLFFAMPLKYGLGLPLAVRIVGSLHGALFVAFVVVLGWAHVRLRWSLVGSGLLFLSALLPFGFLMVDRVLSRPEAKTEASA